MKYVIIGLGVLAFIFLVLSIWSYKKMKKDHSRNFFYGFLASLAAMLSLLFISNLKDKQGKGKDEIK